MERDPTPEERETYTHGYHATSKQMSLRTAETHASFFLPFLKSGLRILDCGCGPGTITVGLARAVAPGAATGIDIAPSEISQARMNAERQGVTNVRFDVASAYELPFPDQSFDAVFSHAMLEHVGEPRRALGEIRRVLKPGGVIGLRDSILRGHVWHPADPVIDAAFDIWLKVWRHNGGDPDIGLEQPAMLSGAGFEVFSSSAAYDIDFHDGMGWSIGPLLLQSSFVETAIGQGWADYDALRRLHDGLVKWSQQPFAVWYFAWGEVVARKQ
jgi:SAM-dependent methyltransferase